MISWYLKTNLSEDRIKCMSQVLPRVGETLKIRYFGGEAGATKFRVEEVSHEMLLYFGEYDPGDIEVLAVKLVD